MRGAGVRPNLSQSHIQHGLDTQLKKFKGCWLFIGSRPTSSPAPPPYPRPPPRCRYAGRVLGECASECVWAGVCAGWSAGGEVGEVSGLDRVRAAVDSLSVAEQDRVEPLGHLLDAARAAGQAQPALGVGSRLGLGLA